MIVVKEITQPNLFESILSGILGPEISSNAEKVIAHFGIPDFFHKHVPGALKGIAKDALAIGTFFYIRNQDRNDAREAVKYLLDVAKTGDQDAQLRLGTSYMRLVMENLDNHPVLTSAAYNAGPGRAKRWRADRPLEGAVYAETIPFNETRDYVKKVMSNSVYYSMQFTGRPDSLKARLGVVGARAEDVPKDADLP